MNKDLRFKDYRIKKIKIDLPMIHTRNTLMGKAGYSLDSYWMNIPRKTVNELGIKLIGKDSDFEVIIRRKK